MEADCLTNAWRQIFSQMHLGHFLKGSYVNLRYSPGETLKPVLTKRSRLTQIQRIKSLISIEIFVDFLYLFKYVN